MFGNPTDTLIYRKRPYNKRRLVAALGGGAVVAPTLPSGSLAGVWYASDYAATPRKMIKNAAVNGTADQNLSSSPRRLFSQGGFYSKTLGAGVTLVDSNTTAPDGSSDASTVSTPGSVVWNITRGNMTVPNGTTFTVCVSARLVSGSGDFKLGQFSTNAACTATGTWQRFTYTFTSSTSVTAYIQNPASQAAQVLEICDFELFAGSADLNPAPLSAAPLALRNMDLVLGKSHYDTTTSVSGGFIANGTLNNLQALSAANLAAYTVIYVAKQTASPTTAGYYPLLSNNQSHAQFTVGMEALALGSYYNGSALDLPIGVSAVQSKFDLWTQSGAGPYVGAHRYTGTVASSFVNGVKLMKNTTTKTPPSNIRDFLAGAYGGASIGYSGHDIAAMALYTRALTDAEIVTAQAALLLNCSGVTLTTPRTVFFCGTSLTFGNSGTSFAYRYPADASPKVHGVNAGISGAAVGPIATAVRSYLTELASYTFPAQTIIFSLEIGANDFLASTSATVLPLVQSLCDDIRAAGFKVALHTCLARNSAGDGGTFFNAQRNAYNAVIRTWVGTHVDAIIDVASDATIGTDASPNNTTYFAGDKTHTLDAGYVIWETYVAPVLNAL